MHTLLLLAFSSLSGCGADDPPPSCAEGFTLGDGDLCYQDAPPTDGGGDTADPDPTGDPSTTGDDPVEVDDVLADLPPCTSEGTGDGDLDLQRGCAGGLCVGWSMEEMVAAIGEPVECSGMIVEYAGLRYGTLDCLWASGVGSTLLDFDTDGVADPGRANFGIDVGPPYAGTSPDGLGLGQEVSCFVDAHEANAVNFDHGDRRWRATYVSFERFAVADYTDARGDGGPDGRVDRIYLDEPLY